MPRRRTMSAARCVRLVDIVSLADLPLLLGRKWNGLASNFIAPHVPLCWTNYFVLEA